ncbi:MAG: tandem-95 repeat protein [Pseudomonadota bacterium]
MDSGPTVVGRHVDRFVDAHRAISNGKIDLPDGEIIFSGDFARDADNLLITGPDGSLTVIAGYFSEGPAALVAPNGNSLSARTVTTLAKAGQEDDLVLTTVSGAPIGQVEGIEGSATVERADGSFEELTEGMRVQLGDVVSTGEGSVLTLLFVDGTVFTLNEDARMTLDELVYTAGAEDGNSASFGLVKGGFVFIAGKVAGSGGMDIETPAATLGIRGTTGTVRVTEDDGGQLLLQVTLEEDPVPGGGFGKIGIFSRITGEQLALIETGESVWEVTIDGVTTDIARSPDAPNAVEALLVEAAAAFGAALRAQEQGEALVPLGGSRSFIGSAGEGGDGGEGFATDPGELGDTLDTLEDGTEADDSQSDDADAPDQQRSNPLIGPEPEPIRFDTDEDAPVNGTLSLADLGDASDLTVITGPENGSLALTDDGTFSYIPDPNFAGTDGFVVSAETPQGETVNTVTLVVRPVNDAPEVAAAEGEVAEDSVLAGTLEATDIENDPLTFTLTEQAANGTVALAADGSYTYRPDADFVGDDSFAYLVSDGDLSTEGTVSLSVTGEPDAAVISGQISGAVTEDIAMIATGVLIVSDADAGEDAITPQSNIRGSYGTFEISAAGVWSYALFASDAAVQALGVGDQLTDSFSVATVDGTEQVVEITVNGANDAPEVSGAVVLPGGTEDLELIITEAQLLAAATDVDESDVLSVSGVPVADTGTVVANEDGTFTFQPDANITGPVRISFAISDGNGASVPAAANLTIAPVNDSPVPEAAEVAGSEDTVIRGQLEATDVDGDALSFALVNGPASGTVIVSADGSFAYTPDADFSGTDSFTYLVSDGVFTAAETATIEVAPVNDGPEATALGLVAEAGAASGQLSVADVDDASGFSFAVSGAGPSNGSVEIDAVTGAFTYTADAGFEGFDRFEVSVRDTGGAVTTATIGIAVGNDAVSIENGQDLSISIEEDAAADAGAGSVQILTSAPEQTTDNLVIILDRSGSVGESNWETLRLDLANALTDTTDPGLTSLFERFEGSQSSVQVSVVTYAGEATVLEGPGGQTTFDLLSDREALFNALSTAPFTGGITNFGEAFSAAELLLDAANADGAGNSFVYFATDGRPSDDNWEQAFANLINSPFDGRTPQGTGDYEVTVEAFGIGGDVDVDQLNAIDSNDAVTVNGSAALADAFINTPLFSAELVAFSLQLVADGEDRGVIVTQDTQPAFTVSGLHYSVALAEVSGLVDILGDQNLLFAEAVFDLDGDVTTVEDRETLRTGGALGIGDEAVTKAGTDQADLLFGSVLDDALSGGDAADILIGGAGDDTLTGGSGADSLLGGAGDDVLVAGGASEAGDVYDGGAGRDTLALIAPEGAEDLLPLIDAKSIEAISLTNADADVLDISLGDVLEMQGEADPTLEQLLGQVLDAGIMIDGNAGDTVNLDGAAASGDAESITRTGTVAHDGTSYDVYEFTGANSEVLAVLAIDQDIVVNGATTGGA